MFQTPMFLNSRDEFKNYLENLKNPLWQLFIKKSEKNQEY